MKKRGGGVGWGNEVLREGGVVLSGAKLANLLLKDSMFKLRKV